NRIHAPVALGLTKSDLLPASSSQPRETFDSHFSKLPTISPIHHLPTATMGTVSSEATDPDRGAVTATEETTVCNTTTTRTAELVAPRRGRERVSFAEAVTANVSFARGKGCIASWGTWTSAPAQRVRVQGSGWEVLFQGAGPGMLWFT